jgi:GH25 family lysozyme M1 (1,4-beta-N-acetylmuramidase)
MGLIDIFLNAVRGASGQAASSVPVQAIPTSAPPVANRYGTFIIPDVYPLDPTGATPPFQVLPGLNVEGKEVVGCYIKASQGTGWAPQYEQWFRTNWQRMAAVRDGRPTGTEFHRGTYHFLVFLQDGAAQADYFADLIQSAGGWGEGDLMPWVDVESGGQGAWDHGVEDLSTLDTVTKAKLAADVTRVTTAYIARLKQRFPGIRVGLYGRGIFRDLAMTSCRFGADAVCNPAYTSHPPSMITYGWPLSDMVEWQLAGDGQVAAVGFPVTIPGWGVTDYSVYVNGSLRTGLQDLYQRCLAFPPTT